MVAAARDGGDDESEENSEGCSAGAAEAERQDQRFWAAWPTVNVSVVDFVVQVENQTFAEEENHALKDA